MDESILSYKKQLQEEKRLLLECAAVLDEVSIPADRNTVIVQGIDYQCEPPRKIRINLEDVVGAYLATPIFEVRNMLLDLAKMDVFDEKSDSFLGLLITLFEVKLLQKPKDEILQLLSKYTVHLDINHKNELAVSIELKAKKKGCCNE